MSIRQAVCRKKVPTRLTGNDFGLSSYTLLTQLLTTYCSESQEKCFDASPQDAHPQLYMLYLPQTLPPHKMPILNSICYTYPKPCLPTRCPSSTLYAILTPNLASPQDAHPQLYMLYLPQTLPPHKMPILNSICYTYP